MYIDARTLEHQELVLKIREILAAKHGCEVNIEILISTMAEVKKIKAFVTMSGCNAEVDKKDDSYIMHVTGAPCCS